MTTMEQAQQVMGALGYPVALPQTVVPVTKTQSQVQRTQYNPEKLQSVIDALKTPTVRKSKWESFANALAATPEARSFTGAYGTEVINPWAMGLSSLARGFGSAYGDRLASEREAAIKDQENALKAAQIAMDADKQVISDQIAQDYIKVNDPKAKTAEQQIQQMQQREAAKSALKELADISEGGIGGWNNEADSRWNSKTTARLLGRRDQALSALIPLTNALAKASGGSGINTLGEMMAYVGLPENATSEQIKGALPGLINKLGFSMEEIMGKTQSKPIVINGYTVVQE